VIVERLQDAPRSPDVDRPLDTPYQRFDAGTTIGAGD